MSEEAFKLSPMTHPQPYDSSITLSYNPLRIGVIEDESILKPCATSIRAVKMAK